MNRRHHTCCRKQQRLPTRASQPLRPLRGLWSTTNLPKQGSALHLCDTDFRRRSPDPLGLTLSHWHHDHGPHHLNTDCLGEAPVSIPLAPFALLLVVLLAQISVACPMGALPVAIPVPPALTVVPSILASILPLQTPVSSSDSQQADKGIDGPTVVTRRGFLWHGKAVQPSAKTPPA